MDVRLPDGTVIQNVPDGMSKTDLVSKLKSSGYDTSSFEPASVSVGKGLNDVPRQVGLTARYLAEGLAEAGQIVTEPIANLMRMGGIKTDPMGKSVSRFADYIGLPKPEGANERVIGDASKMVAGAILPMKFGQAAGGMIAGMADAPLSQGLAAAGAGLAGGSSREAGGSPLQQAGASVIGGVGGGMLPGLVQGAGNAAINGIKSLLPNNQANIDARITMILQNQGIDFSQLPRQAQNALRQDLARAINVGDDLNPAAVARLADFRSVGATPTRGTVTLDPVQITREKNLSKIGANSSDGSLQGLPLIENQNNARLIQNLNSAGAANGDVNAAGNMLASTVIGRRDALRGAEQSAWNAAKSSPGYTQPISSSAISDINRALGDEGLMPFMNPTISKYMEAFQTGNNFTPQAYRNLQSMLAREIAKGGNEGAAASLARRTLESSNLQPPQFANAQNAVVTGQLAQGLRGLDGNAAEAISAVNTARGATRQAYAFEDSSPLVRNILSDSASSDPQRIAQRYIVGGTSREAEEVAIQVGEQGREVIKNALLSHLKSKALNDSADEVGKFSQSAFNKALNAIGERKLNLFFAPEELAQLRANARVASYIQVQPVGSAVNNSNSGALGVAKVYDAIRGGLGKVPGVGPVGAGLLDLTLGQPTKNAATWLNTRDAQNFMPGLLMQQEKPSLMRSLVAPGFAAGGLLASP